MSKLKTIKEGELIDIGSAIVRVKSIRAVVPDLAAPPSLLYTIKFFLIDGGVFSIPYDMLMDRDTDLKLIGEQMEKSQ